MDIIVLYLELEPVCSVFWGLNPPKEGPISNQNKGHWGSRYIYIYIYKCIYKYIYIQLNLYIYILYISTQIYGYYITWFVICWPISHKLFEFVGIQNNLML